MNNPVERVHKAQILVVDDSPSDLQFLVKILRGTGYTVYPASEGHLALQFIESTLPDIILLDLNMPGINGYEVCEKLKADPRTRDIAVIFISGADEVLDKVTAFSKGAVDYILKPFQAEETLARVQTHLSLRNTHRSLLKLQKDLEERVQERTVDLISANERLRAEIDARKQVEDELRKHRHHLEELIEDRTAELNAAKQRAEVASEAKSIFLANMSHELRSPLNVMLGFTRLLLHDQRLFPEGKEDLGIVLKSCEHLYTLINQVLNLSKIEAGRTTVTETNFDLMVLLAELAEMFTVIAKEKKLKLIVDIESQTPRFIRGDAVKLRQVLINLLSNAFKFTSEGGVTLRVGVEGGAEASDSRLQFAVVDTGIGIAPDEVMQLGKAFVQAEAGRQAMEGTGLGLALSRNFVELMNGHFEIDSSPNNGTAIRFALPLVVVDKDSVITSDHTSRRVIGLAPHQPIYRILVAEDRIESRQLLVRLLRRIGFEIREAVDGQEAVTICEEWAPHLIWMDMRMPVMNGRDATRRIKATSKGKSTVVIALTASGFDEEREQVLSEGCDDFLRKPFNEEALFALLQKHLGVRFIFDEHSAAHAALPDKAHLTALPVSLRKQLDDALKNLDDDAIDLAISKIHEMNPGLGKALSVLAKNFSYDKIHSLLA